MRQRDEAAGRHDPRLLHRPRRVDADEDEAMADVRVSGQAGGALTTPVKRTHRHRIPDGHALDALTES